LDVDPAKIEKIFDDAKLFDCSDKDFMAKSGKVFTWSSDKKDEAVYAIAPKRPQLKFFDVPVTEARFSFKDSKLAAFSLTLYNRGDVGDFDQEGLNKLVSTVESKISTWAGGKPTPLKKTRLTSDSEVEAQVWVKEPLALTLKWSYTGRSRKDFKAEYLRVFGESFDPADDPRKQKNAIGDMRGGMAMAKDLPANVARDGSAVHIGGIPMIDQGGKGYCAAATIARVLRYYKLDVTQHDVAQIAGTDATFGTSAKSMMDGMRKVTTRYGVKVRELCKPDEIKTVFEMERYLKRYNSFAKKNGGATVALVEDGNTVYVDKTIERFDKKLRVKMKVETEKNDFKTFQRNIKTNIDKGLPLLWCLELGIVPEPEIPQAKGFHMRLITGYDDAKREITYTDSWGAGHEAKKMSYENAFGITTYLIILEPLK
jgi:hypothetical protein